MSKLMEISPSGLAKTKNVPTAEGDIEVTRIASVDFTGIMARFPIVAALLEGERPSVVAAIESGAQALAAIVAAGCGYPNDQAAERKVVDTFDIDDQMMLAEEIMGLTLPKAMRPALEKFGAAARKFVTEMQEIDLEPVSPAPIASRQRSKS